MDSVRYKAEFDKAVQATKKYNADYELPQSTKLLSESKKVQNTIIHNFEHVRMLGDISILSKSCVPIHRALKSIVDRMMPECQLVMTHGWVQFDEKRVFETDLRYLDRQIRLNKKSPKTSPIDVHTWLTCVRGDTFELYDFTLPLHLEYKYDHMGLEPPFFISSSEDETRHHRVHYKPLLVGTFVAEQLNIIDPFWTEPEILQLPDRSNILLKK